VDTAPSLPARPVDKIRATSGWKALDFAGVWRYRDVLLAIAGRDVKLRYKQTFLGIAWVLLQPLLAAGIFTFVFGFIAKMPSDGKPYFIFSYAGLLGWNLFSNTVTRTSTSLISNSQMISKIYFPRLVLPFSTVPSTLLDFGVSLGMFVVFMLVYRLPVGWPLLLFPVWLVLLLMLSCGVGLWSSALSVSYRDVQYILPVVMQFLLYGSPVAYSLAYSLSKLPPHLRVFLNLNPLSSLLEAIRWSLLGSDSPDWRFVAYSAAVCILTLITGAFIFKRMERQFADVI
jgi:lipopolysaccharide transport system permease protein